MADYIRLAPGQQRPIRIKLRKTKPPFMLSVHVEYTYLNSSMRFKKIFTHQLPIVRDIFAPHQFTYLHPSGIVSSGIIKPPKSIAAKKPTYMLLALHGAGVENNSPFWANDAYCDLNDINAFIIQPSGVTSWGDDWHTWSNNDVKAAQNGVYFWTETVRACLPNDLQFVFWDPVILAGHSNGGEFFLKNVLISRTGNMVCLDALVRFGHLGWKSCFWILFYSRLCPLHLLAISRS